MYVSHFRPTSRELTAVDPSTESSVIQFSPKNYFEVPPNFISLISSLPFLFATPDLPLLSSLPHPSAAAVSHEHRRRRRQPRAPPPSPKCFSHFLSVFILPYSVSKMFFFCHLLCLLRRQVCSLGLWSRRLGACPISSAAVVACTSAASPPAISGKHCRPFRFVCRHFVVRFWCRSTVAHHRLQCWFWVLGFICFSFSIVILWFPWHTVEMRDFFWKIESSTV